MRGHLQRRGDDAWRVKVYVGRSGDGRKRYIERTVHGARRDAERELSRLVVEVDEGRHAATAPMSFGELLDRWLAVKKLAVEPTTLSSYEWVARTYLRPALADRKLASLRPLELDGLYAELSERGLSPRTVRICHTVIRQALEQARKWGLIARSPAVDATPPRQQQHEVSPPTVAEVRGLVAAARAEDPDFGMYLWLLAATGCRRGEGCALRWSDVDLDACQLTIRRSIAMADGVPFREGNQDPSVPPVGPRRRHGRSATGASAPHARTGPGARRAPRRRRSPVCRCGRPSVASGCVHEPVRSAARPIGSTGRAAARPAPLRGHRARRRRGADRHDQQPPRASRHGHHAEHLHARAPGLRPTRGHVPRKPAQPQPQPRRLRRPVLTTL